MVRPSPLPLRSDLARGQTLIDAACTVLLANVKQEFIGDVIAKHGEFAVHRRAIEFLTRSAVTTDTTTSLDEFTQTSGLETVSVLAPASGVAPAFDTGIRLTLGTNAGLNITNIVAASGNASAVGQNKPIPVRQLSVDATVIKPFKYGVIIPFNREAIDHSIPNLRMLVQTAIADSVALTFDTDVMSDDAASAAKPAGLRQGIAAATAKSDATSRYEAMMADLQTLIASVSAVANNGPIAIIASPAKATAIKLGAPKPFAWPVYATSGLASGLCCAVACNSLVSAFDPVPRFSVSTVATTHMDTSPAELTTATTAAFPVRSAFQQDLVLLRMILECSWALRNASGLAWLTTTAW